MRVRRRGDRSRLSERRSTREGRAAARPRRAGGVAALEPTGAGPDRAAGRLARRDRHHTASSPEVVEREPAQRAAATEAAPRFEPAPRVDAATAEPSLRRESSRHRASRRRRESSLRRDRACAADRGSARSRASASTVPPRRAPLPSPTTCAARAAFLPHPSAMRSFATRAGFVLWLAFSSSGWR